MKELPDLATQIRSTFQASREAIRRSHERAFEVQERARQMREAYRHRSEAYRVNQADLSRFEEQTHKAVREQQRFIAIVSHELRQPLNAAVTAMSLLDAGPSADSYERARVVLRRQLLHMSTLLDDLLDMSRVALKTMRVERKDVDLRSVVQDAFDAIEGPARAAAVIVDLEVPTAAVSVLADSARLQQAFSNLLTNAVRYTGPDGHVNVSLTVAANTAVVDVVDTGQGINPADLTRIFEPFWRGADSSEQGFGIGLALVRGIVQLHDGSVAAFSEGRGAGARFSVTLPTSTA